MRPLRAGGVLLGAVALAALAACQRRQNGAPDAGPTGAPDAAVAVLRPALAPRSCPSLERCLGACDAGNASGCYEATLFLLEARADAGRDLSLIPVLAARACEAGDGRGCMRASRLDDAARLLPRECEGGSIESCELLWSWAREADAGAIGADAARRATTLLEQACASPQPWACGRLGSILARGRLGKFDVKRGVALLEAACTDGVAGACLEATLIFSRGLPGFEPDPARAAATGRRARELSAQTP